MTTKIEWTDATWNPTTGCDRVSPGCDNCYALTMAGRLKRMGSAKYQADGDPHTSGPGFKLTVHPDTLDLPLTWRKPRRVFVNSMSDLFHPDVPDAFIVSVYARMVAAGWHIFQVLTKRPQRMAQLLGAPDFAARVQAEVHALHTHMFAGFPYPSVWLGTSIENDRYTFRADHLRATPAAVRFLSLEPLIGPLPSLDLTGIDWVIAGGESGRGARPMHPDWARDIRDRCLYAGIPFFFKQWGAWVPVETVYDDELRDDVLVDGYDDNEVVSFNRAAQIEMRLPKRGGSQGHQPNPAGAPWWMANVGKKAAGRELDGYVWNQVPA
jgi:protein gp37